MSKRVLLVAAKTGYQVREFYGAAKRLGFELALATDRCHVLDDPWADQATPVQFSEPGAAVEALRMRGPFDGIVAVGDQPALVAAEIAASLGLRFHAPEAVRVANDKFLTRERLREAGCLVPSFALDPLGEPRYPCVLKPLNSSGSRGVIRANNRGEYKEAFARIGKMTRGARVLVEDFIPGREFALEGILTGGQLHILAIFDKPDPLDGPYFEETIYITPSREPVRVQSEIKAVAQRAVAALGLTQGPAHGEMRVNEEGVWVLEVAARPIGGLCARGLRFGAKISLEELLLLNAVGTDISDSALTCGEHAVMMIPIPQSGIYFGVDGVDRARQVVGISEVEITAKIGQKFETLPEGASYLGFIFAHAATSGEAERALRLAYSRLKFSINPALPVMHGRV
jgi:biotin carboxylase